jgi:L-lactate dehydrogenase complex protein LldE
VRNYVATFDGFGDDALAARAEAVASKTYELSEFLVDVLGRVDVGAYYPHTVTYHPTCRSLRVLRVGELPVQLLRQVEALELVELPGADSCCGFGGLSCAHSRSCRACRTP